MTDEQIEQRAAEYAKEHYDIPFEDNRTMNVIVSEESYIAGAHSRDEEIRQLHDVINDYSDTIEKLRNPWISVKERRPNYPESEYDIDNMYLVCREGGSIAFPAIFRRNGKWYIYDNMQVTEIIAPDYWMPMPLKKGE